MMTSVKAILTEMLSTFEAKSRMSAKHLKDQLHACWPVPNSRVTMDQLKKELRDEMKQSLEVVSSSLLMDPMACVDIHVHVVTCVTCTVYIAYTCTCTLLLYMYMYMWVSTICESVSE